MIIKDFLGDVGKSSNMHGRYFLIFMTSHQGSPD